MKISEIGDVVFCRFTYAGPDSCMAGFQLALASISIRT